MKFKKIIAKICAVTLILNFIPNASVQSDNKNSNSVIKDNYSEIDKATSFTVDIENKDEVDGNEEGVVGTEEVTENPIVEESGDELLEGNTTQDDIPANGDPANGDSANGDPANGDPANGDSTNSDSTNGEATNPDNIEADTNIIDIKRYDNTVAFKIKINRKTGKISVIDRDGYKIDDGLYETYLKINIYNEDNKRNTGKEEDKPVKSIEVKSQDVANASEGLNQLNGITLTDKQYITIDAFYPEYVSIFGDIEKGDKITEENYTDGVKDPDQLENVKLSIKEDKSKLKLTYDNKNLNSEVKSIVTPLFKYTDKYNNESYRSPFKIAINSVKKTFQVIDIKNQYVLPADGEDVVFRFKVFSKGGTEKVNLEVKGNQKAVDIDFSKLENLVYEDGDRITMWVKDRELFRIKGDVKPAENTTPNEPASRTISNNSLIDYSNGITLQDGTGENQLGFNYADIMTRRGFNLTNEGLQELNNKAPTMTFATNSEGTTDITISRGDQYYKDGSPSYILKDMNIVDEDDTWKDKVTYKGFDDTQDRCVVTYTYTDSWGLTVSDTRTVHIQNGMLRHTLKMYRMKSNGPIWAADIKFDTNDNSYQNHTSDTNDTYDGKLKVTIDEHNSNVKLSDMGNASTSYIIAEIILYNEDGTEKNSLQLKMNDVVSRFKELEDIKFKYGDFVKVKVFSEKQLFGLLGYVKDAPEDYSDGADNPANLQKYMFKITSRGLEAIEKNMDYNISNGESFITIRNTNNPTGNIGMAYFSLKVSPRNEDTKKIKIMNAKNAAVGIPQFSIQVFDSNNQNKGNKITTNTNQQPMLVTGELSSKYLDMQNLDVAIGDFIEIWSSDLDGLEVHNVIDARDDFSDGIQENERGGASADNGEYQKYVRFEVTEKGLKAIYNEVPKAEYDDLIIYKKKYESRLSLEEVKEGIVIKDPYYDYQQEKYSEYIYQGNYKGDAESSEGKDPNGITVTVNAVSESNGAIVTDGDIDTIHTDTIGSSKIRYTVTDAKGRISIFDRNVRVIDDVEKNILEFEGTNTNGDAFTLFKLRLNSITKKVEMFDISSDTILDPDYLNDKDDYINLNLYGYVKDVNYNNPGSNNGSQDSQQPSNRLSDNNQESATKPLGYRINSEGKLVYPDGKVSDDTGYSTDEQGYIIKDNKRVVLKKGSFSLKGGQLLSEEIVELVGNVEFAYDDYITLYHAKMKQMKVKGAIKNTRNELDSNVSQLDSNTINEKFIDEDYRDGIDKPENMQNVAFKITESGIEAIKYDNDKRDYKNVIVPEYPESIPFKIVFDETDSKIKVVEQTNQYLCYESSSNTAFMFYILSAAGEYKAGITLSGYDKGTNEELNKFKEGVEYVDGDQIFLFSSYPGTLKFKTDNIIKNLESYEDGFQFIQTINNDSTNEGNSGEGSLGENSSGDVATLINKRILAITNGEGDSSQQGDQLPQIPDVGDSSGNVGNDGNDPSETSKEYIDSILNIRFKIKTNTNNTMGPSLLTNGNPEKPLVFETMYNKAPEIEENSKLVITKGAGLSEEQLKEKLMEGLTITDDYDEYKKNNESDNSNKGSIKVEINHNIDQNKVGYYGVHYIFMDSWGAMKEFTREIVVSGNIESNKVKFIASGNRENDNVQIGFEKYENSGDISTYNQNSDGENYDGKLTLTRNGNIEASIVSLTDNYVGLSVGLYDSDGNIRKKTKEDGTTEEIKVEKIRNVLIKDPEFNILNDAKFKYGDYLVLYTFNSTSTWIEGDIINGAEGETYDTGIKNDFNLKNYKFKITPYGLEAVLDSQYLVGYKNANIISPTFFGNIEEVRTAFSLRVRQVERNSEVDTITTNNNEVGDIKIEVINPQEIHLAQQLGSNNDAMRIVIKNKDTGAVKYAYTFSGNFKPVSIINGNEVLNPGLTQLQNTVINHGDILIIWTAELDNLNILGKVQGTPRKDFAYGLDEFGNLNNNSDSQDTTIASVNLGTTNIEEGKASFWDFASYVRFKFTENGLEVMYNDAPDIVIENDINLNLGGTADILKNVTVTDDIDNNLEITVDEHSKVTEQSNNTVSVANVGDLSNSSDADSSDTSDSSNNQDSSGDSSVPSNPDTSDQPETPEVSVPTTTKIYTADNEEGIDVLTYRAQDSWGRKTVLERAVTVKDSYSNGLINNSITYLSKDKNGESFYPFKIIFDNTNKKIRVIDRKRKVIAPNIDAEDFIRLTLYGADNQEKVTTTISSKDQGFSANVNKFDNITFEDGDYIKIYALYPHNIIIDGNIEGADNSEIKKPVSPENDEEQEPGDNGNNTEGDAGSNGGSEDTPDSGNGSSNSGSGSDSANPDAGNDSSALRRLGNVVKGLLSRNDSEDNNDTTTNYVVNENYKDGVNDPFNLLYTKFTLEDDKIKVTELEIPDEHIIFNPMYEQTLNDSILQGTYKIIPFKIYVDTQQGRIYLYDRINMTLDNSHPNKLMFNFKITNSKTNKTKIDVKILGIDTGESNKLYGLDWYDLEEGDLITASSSDNVNFRILGDIKDSIQDTSYANGITTGDINAITNYYELLLRFKDNVLKQESNYPRIVRQDGGNSIITLERDAYENTLEAKDKFLRSLVTAVDLIDGDITKNIKYVDSNFDPTRTGEYTIIYTITDKDKYMTTFTQKIQVVRTINVSVPKDSVNIKVNNIINGDKTITTEDFVISNHSTNTVDVYVKDLVELPSNSGEIFAPDSYEFKTISGLNTIRRIAVGLYTDSGFKESSYTSENNPLWLDKNNKTERKLGKIDVAPNLKYPTEGKVKLTVKTADNMIIGRSNSIFDLRLVFR